MRVRRCLLPTVVATALLAISGCSDSDEGSDSSTTTVTSLATDQVDDTVNADTLSSCRVDSKVLEVAVEAYLANGGVEPITQAQLIDAQMLRTEIATFELMADGSATVVVATPGGPCDGVDLSLADGGGTQVFDAADGETSCEEERLVLELALETYLANGGTLPVTETDLLMAGLLRTDFADYDIDGELVVPVGDRCAGA